MSRLRIILATFALAIASRTCVDVTAATGHEPLHLAVPPPLRIRLVPVVLAAHSDERGPVTAQLLEYYLQSVRAFFPHSRIDATIGSVPAGFVDAAFPDARGAIGEGAHDTFAWEIGRAVAATAVSA